MGMRSDTFMYVRTLEKIHIALLDMFNNIRVNRYDDITRKKIIKTLKVPLVTHFDKNFGNYVSNLYSKHPRMPIPIAGIRLTGIRKNDSGRTQATYPRHIFSRANDQWLSDITPTPYYLGVTLEFLMDQMTDLGQIVENIAPYFNPSRTLRIMEWDHLGQDDPANERKVQVNLEDITWDIADEMQAGPTHRYINLKFTFKLEIELYRAMELSEMIKYAELNMYTDEFMEKHQHIGMPTELALKERKPFETVSATDEVFEGYSVLNSACHTLVKVCDVDGKCEYEDINVPPGRPIGVPDTKQLQLLFNADSDNEKDFSPYSRDFTLLNNAQRQFVPGMEPGNGQEVSGGGYGVDPNVKWDKILTWFGTNNGLLLSPLTFQTKLQFNEDNPLDMIFQELSNDATETIPKGEVFFEWGLFDGHLYYRFKTYGTNSLEITFKTITKLSLNDVDIYTFVFAHYNEGKDGMFAYRTNEGDFIALDVEKE